MKFVSELRRRRRGFVVFIIWVIAVLSIITGRLAFHLLRPDPASDTIDPAREWGAFLFLGLPWIVAIVLAWRHLRHRSRHARFERSIADCLRALLDENRVAQFAHRAVVLLHLAMLLVVPVVVYQLRAAGKAGGEILVPAFVIWPIIVLGIVAAMHWRYRRKLLPRQLELESLLRDCE
ncbi:MAG: hypothetical protein ACREIA_11460 [Opitutaceae bacterium]